MKQVKLASLGALYSGVASILLVVIGVCFFHKSLKLREYLGLGLGLASVVLLSS